MPNNAPDVIFFVGTGFSKIQVTLPLKRIWALAVEDETEKSKYVWYR